MVYGDADSTGIDGDFMIGCRFLKQIITICHLWLALITDHNRSPVTTSNSNKDPMESKPENRTRRHLNQETSPCNVDQIQLMHMDNFKYGGHSSSGLLMFRLYTSSSFSPSALS